MLAVGTVYDHVSSWRSVYKIHLLTDTEVTFVLTNGGHNVGIVPPPGAPNRYRMASRKKGLPWQDADAWLAAAKGNDGSWWPAWQTTCDGYDERPVPGARKRAGNLRVGAIDVLNSGRRKR